MTKYLICRDHRPWAHKCDAEALRRWTKAHGYGASRRGGVVVSDIDSFAVVSYLTNNRWWGFKDAVDTKQEPAR